MSTDTPTSCLGNPQPVTCGTTSITLRWHLTSSITLETTLPSNEGSGLTPRPGFHQAGHGLDSVPSRTNITHYPRPELSAREAKFSFHKTRPHPLAGSQPSEKKGGGGGCWHWQVQGLPCQQPTCSPAPHCLPSSSSFPGHQLPNAASSTEERRDPVSPGFYPPSSCHTNQGAGAPGATQSSALPEVKFPFPRRQRLKGQGRPPRGHRGNPQGNCPHHSSPQT